MAKLTITPLAGNTYFIPSPANCGLYVRANKAILIDSGNDKESGRQIAKLIEEQGWQLDLVVNTHSNADHIGGNAFLQNKTQCRIAATRLEAALIENPFLEPCLLYGGFPMDSLRNKFLLAQPSRVTDLIDNSGPIAGTDLHAMSLPGHFLDMIGVRNPDNVLFLADSLFSETILTKYHLTFMHDLAGHLATLDRLEQEQAAWFVPSHAPCIQDISELIRLNRAKCLQVLDCILETIEQSASHDTILAAVCRHFGILLNPNQYVLVGSTVRAYLSYAVNRNLAEVTFDDGQANWKRLG